MADSVFMEHGMTTIPSVRTDPLAIDAARSPILYSVSVPFLTWSP